MDLNTNDFFILADILLALNESQRILGEIEKINQNKIQILQEMIE